MRIVELLLVLLSIVVVGQGREVNIGATCDPPCVDGHGECIVLENSHLAPHLQDHAYCNCSATPTAFYYGKACEHEEIITCDPPCGNNGICEVIELKGQCKCLRNSTGSFSGYRCSTFDADCNPPCLNGGTCYYGSYCSCAKTSDGYYTGDRCQNFSKECDPPCLNGGSCSYGYCSCVHTQDGYYSGIKCANFTNYTDRTCNPDCVNGECIGGWCQCWSNSTVKFTGQACENANRKSDPCPSPCQNGGICEFGSCSCVSNSSHYIYGSSCEYSQACFCENGGSCTYGRCDCPFRYTGDKCETYLSECPCKNGGSCEVDPNICHCSGNETHMLVGQYCEVSQKIYCFPVALNGGWCSHNHYICPYDSHGYFYGDQCLEYKSTADCKCPEHQVCVKGGCTCPYSLKERFYSFGPSCEMKTYI